MGTVKCLFGYCLLKPLDDEDSSGIISPSSVNLPSYRAEVLSVGDGTPDGNGAKIPMQLHVGDIVHYDSSKTKEVQIDGETLYYTDQLAIFSVIKKETTEQSTSN